MSEELKNTYGGDFGFLNPFFDAIYAMPIEGKKINHLMKTDIEEKDDMFEVKVDMPGVNKENIKVSVTNGYLNVSYKQSTFSENKDEKHRYVRKERYFGEAERSFYLGDVDASKVSAELNNGVLNISIPKVVKEDKTNYVTIK